MKVSLLNPVLLAEHYEELVEWYIKTFGLTVKHKTDQEENYTELEQSGKSVVGIAVAKEMGVRPNTPRNNTEIIQLSVSNIDELFVKVKETGGTILFGPSLDKKEGYQYGGIADIEGNQIWVVEEKEK